MQLSGKLAKFADEKCYYNIVENKEVSNESDSKDIAWKKRISTLQSTPTKMTAAIRNILISSIASAQKAHLKEVTNELRSCLKLFRPNAAYAAKSAALDVLEKFGGLEVIDDGEASLDDNDVSMTDDAEGELLYSSGILSDEAVSLLCHFGADNDLDREEWLESVNSCKTLSR